MPIQSYFIRNSELIPTGRYDSGAGAKIYEVCRVMQKIPLFIEEHLARFYRSAALLNIEMPLSASDIEERLRRLISANNVREGNIRFLYHINNKQFEAFFIPHFYPDSKMIRNGVACEILRAERHDPNVKAVQASLRSRTDELIKSGFYEAILVNSQGEITEGSRSNLFFVRGDKLITAPAKDVLCGITRDKVLAICRAENIEVEMKTLPETDLPAMNAAFISGTSPKILPVASIGKVTFKLPNPLISKLIDLYDQQIEAYIKSRSF